MVTTYELYNLPLKIQLSLAKDILGNYRLDQIDTNKSSGRAISVYYNNKQADICIDVLNLLVPNKPVLLV